MPLQKPIFKTIGDIVDQMEIKAFVIGGYVRDYYLYRKSTDIDIVVIGSGGGIAVAEALGKQLNSKVSVFKNFGTAMLNYNGMEIEFVGARKESYRSDSRKPIVEDGTIEDDQVRRDFTINALAWSLNSEDFGELIDPFDGMNDLEKCIIRTPRDPDKTFSDDPLRMIRAIRFASQLGFDIEAESFDAIVRNAERIHIVSKERIVTELNKILLSPAPSIGFELLSLTGLLALIFPEVENLKGVNTVGKHSHKDNFKHTLQVLDNVALKSNNLWLRWAALLHDIAKPVTKAYYPKQGWTFHGHEVIGAKMTSTIFRNMKMPLNEKMKYVSKLVLLHLRPIILSENNVTDSAVRRMLFDAGDDVDDLMLLCEADITSGIESKVKRYMHNFEIVRRKLQEIEAKDKIRTFQPPINGDIIMKTYGIPPCSAIQDIKIQIKDAILDGKIENDYNQAYAMMEKIAESMGYIKIEQSNSQCVTKKLHI